MSRVDRIERGLARLASVKADFVAASERAFRDVRTCEGCDARCCKGGLNSMKVSRIEALALLRRLAKPDLSPLRAEVLDRCRRAIADRGLSRNRDATYTCPLLSPEGLCRVHGPTQPAGCLTFQPVPDGGCDHDLDFFHKHVKRIEAAERKAFGKVYEPLPIPVALL